MISVHNQPVNVETSNSDFTVESYKRLVRLAMKNYKVSDYRSIPWGQKFILWRHDCDHSLNRALALAHIEAEAGLNSTFFLNPHCQFYNILESSQLKLISEIIELGHDIALHFDAEFYGTSTESELDRQVMIERDFLEQFIGVRPAAFSFHNPTQLHLTFESDTYGGLINCYSKKFKTSVPYCSDSNGYWRFRKLYDCLTEAEDPCLQVLTHPGWWQEQQSSPRNRIFRCAYGRAKATMSVYDQDLLKAGRINQEGNIKKIRFIEEFDPDLFALLDYLSNTQNEHLLLKELLRFHQRQIIDLCKFEIHSNWRVSVEEINTLFNDPELDLDALTVWDGVFEVSWDDISLINKSTYQDLIKQDNSYCMMELSASAAKYQSGCSQVINNIEVFSKWGLSQSAKYDGLLPIGKKIIFATLPLEVTESNHLDNASSAVPTVKNHRWGNFKRYIKR